MIIVLGLSIVYMFLFTKFGNDKMASYIENKVNSGQEVKLKVNDFTLTSNHLSFDASINDNSEINISGDLSIFKKTVDLKYDIKINDLSTLRNLTNQDFKGPLFTNGIFTGNDKEAIIQGTSNIANSQTKYYFNMENYEARNINIQMKNAKIEDLLTLLNKPLYVKGDLNVIADIKNANLSKLDGMVITKITNAKIDNDILNKELNQSLATAINFQGDMNAILTPNKAEIKSNLTSPIAEIFMNRTTVDLSTKNIKSDYKIDVKNLAKLEGIISKKLNGQFLTNGNFKIVDKTVQIEGDSNILEGITKYSAEFVNSTPTAMKLAIESAKLEKLLQVLNEPIYATGDLNILANIKSANIDKLDGDVNTRISNGLIIDKVASVVFNQNLTEKINFDLNIDTNLVEKQAISKANIETSIGNLSTQNTVYNVKEATLNSDYLLNIPSLEKLKDILKMNLKGKLDIKGELSDKESAFAILGKADTLNGTLDFNLKNNKLNANLKNIDVQELCAMLDYSKIFDSKANFVFDYDLSTKRGVLDGKLINGHFAENNFVNIIKHLSKLDLTQEQYETFDINTKIDNRVLTSNVIMKSKNTQIDIKDSMLDLEKNLTDTKINVNIKDKTFGLGLKGDTSMPKISFDAKDLKEQIEKQIEKKKDKIQQKLNKFLGEN
jgi:hypothetical protein